MSDKGLFDVVVVGAGPVGAVLASALSHLPIKIAVLESMSSPRQSLGKTIVLSDASVRLLQTLGLWPLLSSHVQPIAQVKVSAQNHFGVVRMQAKANASLGYVVDAGIMGKRLWEALDSNQKVVFFSGVSQTAYDKPSLTFVAQGEEKCVQAHWVLAADGLDSACRKQYGVSLDCPDVDEWSLMVPVSGQSLAQDQAIQRFLPDGVVAYIPAGGAATVIWTAKQARIEALIVQSDAEMACTIAKAFGARFPTVTCGRGKRTAYPIRYHRAHQLVKSNMTLVGNAALSVSPIMAQGLNMALQDVGFIFDLYAGLCRRQGLQDPQEAWSAYAHARGQAHGRLWTQVSTLHKIFAQQQAAWTVMRSVALGSLSGMGFAKKQVITWGTGKRYPVSSLVAGIPLSQTCAALEALRDHIGQGG